MKFVNNRMVIYQVESGSYLYGTNTKDSDEDYISVFIPTKYDLLSLQRCDFIDNSTKKSSEARKNTSEDIDDKQYSISNYLKLVLSGNPNLTEILFCKYPEKELKSFSVFKNNTDKLISRNVYHSFKGFAVSQRKKLEYKAKRYLQLEEAFTYLEAEYKSAIEDPEAKMNDKLAEYLNIRLSEYKAGKNRDSFHENLPLKLIYEKIKEEYNEYGWRTKTDTFKSLGYDVKYASHVIRLFYEGERLLSTGRIDFPITGKAYDDIMAVKLGKVSISEFYELCDYYDTLNEKAFENTILPNKADWDWVNKVLVDMLTNAIRAETILQKSSDNENELAP